MTISSVFASFDSDFAVVMIDTNSEAKLGTFIFDRSLLAQGIEKAAELGARGVVLKFFMDREKSASGDKQFADALRKVPVVLQARMDDTEAHPNPLPDRFFLKELQAKTKVSGSSGWIPLPAFAMGAADVGFVDFGSVEVPMLETYQGRTVKSLVVCCLEVGTGSRASFEKDYVASFGKKLLRLDNKYGIKANRPMKDQLKYIPFHSLLAGEPEAAGVKGKVVIIGYDGAHIHSTTLPIGGVRAHRAFVYVLKSIYEQLE
ncbi:MAG: hypothetical protein JWM16_1285 [Verrucomicrobiales bacterium]|nr:hypothetical protein [Verrucomicrobiales bacterium]